jgi:hypothetical protein
VTRRVRGRERKRELGQRIDRHPSRFLALDRVAHGGEHLVDGQIEWPKIQDLNEPPLDERCELGPERAGLGEVLAGVLLEDDDDPGLSRPGSRRDEVRSHEERHPSPGIPPDI